MTPNFNGVGAEIQAIEFAYGRSPDQDQAQPVRHPVVIVGAGPVGLSLAIDLAQRGQKVVLLDNDHRLSSGSRAICFAKRTLEIWDRLGVGQRMLDKGVSWNVGKVFFHEQQVYQFDLLPEAGHQYPAFINLQQYYAEAYLVERALQLPNIELRWLNKVEGLEQDADGATLTIGTPDGPYRLRADYVAACDGSRSPLRALLGQESKGRVFRDRFLIADVKMKAPFPAERWFWFDPPFHPNQSVLLHRQPDGVWRIDFQLGWDADPEFEKQPAQIIPRVNALLAAAAASRGEADAPLPSFELEWASVYTFACQRMDRFVHNRVIFAGDAAHGVSPFGARGANSGVQDADNLAWKLDAVLRGQAGAALLASYGSEREYAADENLRHSTRATDFITPKSAISKVFRDAVLDLARDHPFARRIVNSGRLSVPATLDGSLLNTPDGDGFAGLMRPGAVCADAPIQVHGHDGWLLSELAHSQSFTLLGFDIDEEILNQLAADQMQPVRTLSLKSAGVDGMVDAQGLAAKRYDAQPGTVYLLRPDQHVAARWRAADHRQIAQALQRALALN